MLREQSSGYITILAVLILGAASLAIALTLVDTAGYSQKAAIVTQQSTQVRSMAQACAEEALQKIHDNTAYTGSSILTIGSNTCLLTVTSTGSNSDTIDTSFTANGVTRRDKAYVTISATSISVTQWQEIL